jgi:hypothetical protein
VAERDAKVRLNLAAAGFLSMMRELEKQSKQLGDSIEDIGKDAKQAEPKVSGLMTALKAGADKGKEAARELVGQLKNGISMAVTFGGALSFGAALKGGVELVDTYQDIAFAIRRSTGAAQDWRDVQAAVEAAAKRWKVSNKEAAASFQDLFKTSEDLDFTTKALNAAARASAATSASMGATTKLAEELGEKFGITGDEIDSAMTTLVGAVPGGKAGLEELAEGLGLVGASARAVGLQGEGGLKQVLGMLNMAGAAGGNFKRELMSVTQLLEQLGDQDQVKNIEKALGTKLRDKGGRTKQDAIERIIIATQGKPEELSKVFTGPVLRFMTELGKTFQDARGKAEGSEREKTVAGLRAFRESLKKAGETSLTSADLEKEAAERMKGPKAQLQDALNRLEQAFTRPQMIAAIDKLAAIAPKLADGLAKLLEFIVDNPVLAGAGFVGAKVGGAALTGAASSAISGALAGKAAAAGAGAGAGGAGAAAGALGLGAKAGLVGLAAGAGVATGIVIGKATVDPHLKRKEQLSFDLATADEESKRVIESGDATQMKRMRDTLAARLSEARRSQGGVMDTVFGGAAKLIDKDFEHTGERNIKKGEKTLKELDAALAKTGKTGDRATVALERMATNAELAAQVFGKFAVPPGGSGTNGLPPLPGNGSGSNP